MAGSIRNSPLSYLIVDPVNNGIAANVVSSEPTPGIGGVVTYSYLGWSDRPVRTDPTGTTVQPVNVINEGAANIATNQVSIGTSATQVVPVNATRRGVSITNLGTTDVWVGAAGVTTATGDLLAGSKGASVFIPTTAAVYAIVGIGTQAVSFMEVYD
jgi:hypothetical protein